MGVVKKIFTKMFLVCNDFYFYYSALNPINKKQKQLYFRRKKWPFLMLLRSYIRLLIPLFVLQKIFKFYLKIGKSEHPVNSRLPLLDNINELLPSLAIHPYLPLVLQRKLIEEAEEKLNLGLYEEAIIILDKAIARYPHSSYPFLMKGLAAFHLEKFEEALYNFDRAVKIDPFLSTAFSMKGEALNKMMRFNEAIKCFDAALNLKKEARTYFLRGNSLTSMNMHDKALYDYNMSLELDPNYIESLKAKARACVFSKNFSEAKMLLKNLTDKYPNQVLTIKGLGEAKQIMQELKMKSEYLKSVT